MQIAPKYSITTLNQMNHDGAKVMSDFIANTTNEHINAYRTI